MLPIDAGQNAMQLICCAVTMVFALFSWFTSSR
jgi:hypothetical protein